MTNSANTGKHRQRKGLRPWKPGESGNPDGVPKATLALRRALEGEAEEIHQALMSLVRDGNVPAIIYAHQQIVGKPKERDDDKPNDSNAKSVLERVPEDVVLSYLNAVHYEATHVEVPKQLAEANPAPSPDATDGL